MQSIPPEDRPAHLLDLAEFGGKGAISVLAGGWSAGPIDKARLPGVVIGVNDAGVLAPRVDFVISMDRLWAEGRWDALKARAEKGEIRRAYIRRSALQNIAERPRWLVPFECRYDTDVFTGPPAAGDVGPARLNGSNSGICALNLAYHLKPARVYLFGFDMCRSPAGEPYWYPVYEWAKPGGATSDGKYRSWVQSFDVVNRRFSQNGIGVYNCSQASKISAFPKIDPRSVLA